MFPSRLTAEFSGGTPPYQHAGAQRPYVHKARSPRPSTLSLTARCNDLLGDTPPTPLLEASTDCGNPLELES
jgi:hypothetical protein